MSAHCVSIPCRGDMLSPNVPQLRAEAPWRVHSAAETERDLACIITAYL